MQEKARKRGDLKANIFWAQGRETRAKSVGIALYIVRLCSGSSGGTITAEGRITNEGGAPGKKGRKHLHRSIINVLGNHLLRHSWGSRREYAEEGKRDPLLGRLGKVKNTTLRDL